MSGAIVSGPGTMKSTLCRLMVHLLNKNPVLDSDGNPLKVIYASFGEPEVPPGATVISPEYLSDFEDFFRNNANSVIILDSLRPLDVLSGPLGSKGRNKAMGQRLTYLDRIAEENKVALFMVFNPNDEPDSIGNYYSTFKSSINYVFCSDDLTTNEALTKQIGKKCRGFKNGEALYSVRASDDRSDKLLLKSSPRALLLSLARLAYQLIKDEVSKFPEHAVSSGSYNCLLSFGITRPASSSIKERFEVLSSAVRTFIQGLANAQSISKADPAARIAVVNSLINTFSENIKEADDQTLIFSAPLPSFQERVNELTSTKLNDLPDEGDKLVIDGFSFSDDDFAIGGDSVITDTDPTNMNKDHF